MPEWVVILCMAWAGFSGYVLGRYGWRAYDISWMWKGQHMLMIGQKVLCTNKFTPSDKYEVPECGKVYTVRDTDGDYLTFEEIRNSYRYEHNGKLQEIAFIDDWFRPAKKEIDFSDVTCPKSVWR